MKKLKHQKKSLSKIWQIFNKATQQITDVYINRDYKNIDIANRKVIDYVKNEANNE
jgi:hypothetical protein